MGRLDVKQQLRDMRITCHKLFIEEFIQLSQKSGEDALIANKLIRGVNMIRRLGPDVRHAKNYEDLRWCGDALYSMHVDTKNYNLRVLFSFEGKDEIFLHTFNEISGKRMTDYRTHIPIALERREEMMKGGGSYEN